jgi:hypothetical protein
MSKGPDRFYVDLNDRKLYEKIENEQVFSDKTRKEQFMFAMATGFRNGVKRPIETREGFFLAKDLRSEDEALMYALALFDHDSPEVLLDRKEVFQIAEQYAHAGIRLLADKVESVEFGSFDKIYERELKTLLDEIEDHP